MAWLIKLLDPSGHWSRAEYIDWWGNVLNTTMLGFWGKFLTAFFIFLGVWVGARRQQMQMAFGCLVIAAAIMYGGGLWAFFSGR